MNSIYMLCTAMATTALAKGPIECDFSELSGTQQCFGAVGQLLLFHLPNTENTDIWLKKDACILLKKVKNKTVTPHNKYVNQSEVFTNGTIKLGYAMKRHTGDYLLEEFGSNGVLLKKVNMHLEIKATVSKPAVSQTCSSLTQKNISCSSWGDEVEFILSLDGYTLIQTRGRHSQSLSSSTTHMQPLTGSEAEQDTLTVSNVTISLHGQLTGNLMCRVWNNVSSDETVFHLTSCEAFIHAPVVVAVRAGVVTLLLLALCFGIWHVHKKTRQ